MFREMNRAEEIRAELEQGYKSLKAAHILYDKDLYEDSLSRCYYSILHSAKAVLVSLDVPVDSHEAVKRLFGQYLIRTGMIEKEYAIILREEQDDRIMADYDITFLPDKDQLKTRIVDARKFFERMTKYLSEKGYEGRSICGDSAT